MFRVCTFAVAANLVAHAAALGTKIDYAMDECASPADIFFLQDCTDTFADDFPNVVAQLPSLVETVKAEFPGTYFGLATFRDKPVGPFGYEPDYIYQLEQQLTQRKDLFIAAWEGLYAGGGRDMKEDQFEALLASLQDPNVGWHPQGDDVTNGQVKGAIIVIITDSPIHMAGDAAAGNSSIPWIPADGIVSPLDVANPLVKDYPSWQQVRDALKASNTYLLSLVTEDVRASYDWINGPDMLDQPPQFVQVLAEDSSNIATVLMNALREYGTYECELLPTFAPRTTTPEPTTPLPPTTTPFETTASTGPNCCCCDGSGMSVEEMMKKLRADLLAELKA